MAGRRAVEVRRRLVGQQHARLVDERPRHRDALLLADAQLSWPMFGPIGESHPLKRRSGELVVVDSAVGRMRARAPTNGAVGAGGECLLGIRPEDLTLLADGTPADANIIEGEIAAARYIGEATVYTLRAGAVDLQFKTHPSVALDVGARARIGAMPEHCALVARAADAASLYGEEDLADLGGGAHAR